MQLTLFEKNGFVSFNVSNHENIKFILNEIENDIG